MMSEQKITYPYPTGPYNTESLEYRKGYLDKTIKRYRYMVDRDIGIPPFPEDMDLRVYGKQWAYIPFKEMGKAAWVWEDREKAVLFYETYGGTKRYAP